MIAAIRRWAERHTEDRRYSPVGIAFHWIMAALIIFQLGWGWHASNLPASGDKIAAFIIHGEVGLAILALALLRVAWRMIVPGPINDADVPGLERTASHATYAVFYVSFFMLPLSGWMMWSTMGRMPPLTLFGMLPWPYLPLESLPTAAQYLVIDWGEAIHQLFVFALAVLTPLHVVAAFKHHWWNRNDVLIGILPHIPDDAPEAPPHRPTAARSRPAEGAG